MSEREIVSGSTGRANGWYVDFEEGDKLNLELTLEEGVSAHGCVKYPGTINEIGEVEIVDFENDGVTESTEVEVPETGEYFVSVTVDTDGRASLSLRYS